MSEDSTTRSSLTLEGLAAEFRAFKDRTEIEASLVRAENARLRRRLAEIEANDGDATNLLPRRQPMDTSDSDASDLDVGCQVSRRGAFKAAGAMAAGGLALVIGSAVLGSDPAAAATGTMKYGESNDAGSSQTTLTAKLKRIAALNVENTATLKPGAGLYAMTVAASGLENVTGAIIGDTNGKAGPAVVGMSSGGSGVYGIQGTKSGIHGAPHPSAVIGDTAGSGAGVVGLSTDGDGLYGVAFDTSGISTGLKAGVLGDTAGGGTGVMGLSSAGDGVHGVANGKSGITTGLQAGVLGDTAGLGFGVLGLSPVAGVYGVAGGTTSLAAKLAGVSGDSTAFAGVVGSSSGNDGIYGVTNAAGHSGIVGIDQGSSSTSHAVFGKSDNGIGGYFQGGLAPLFLAPASSAGPPTSGNHSQGEFHVDSNGAVFVCTSGDGTGVGTWQQLAFVAA